MMYRPPAYAVDDLPALHNAIERRVFATLAAVRREGVVFAYAPVIVDRRNGPRGGIRFHLARQNPLTGLAEGERASLSMLAADAYVSPAWYRTAGRVPTWNYVAVEGEGAVHRLGDAELRTLLAELSAQEEAKLAPKRPWTMDKLAPERTEALLGAIAGFSLRFQRLEGKFKLSQDKPAEDIAGVIAGLEARGNPASLAVAREMRKF